MPVRTQLCYGSAEFPRLWYPSRLVWHLEWKCPDQVRIVSTGLDFVKINPVHNSSSPVLDSSHKANRKLYNRIKLSNTLLKWSDITEKWNCVAMETERRVEKIKMIREIRNKIASHAQNIIFYNYSSKRRLSVGSSPFCRRSMIICNDAFNFGRLTPVVAQSRGRCDP